MRLFLTLLTHLLLLCLQPGVHGCASQYHEVFINLVNPQWKGRKLKLSRQRHEIAFGLPGLSAMAPKQLVSRWHRVHCAGLTLTASDSTRLLEFRSRFYSLLSSHEPCQMALGLLEGDLHRFFKESIPPELAIQFADYFMPFMRVYVNRVQVLTASNWCLSEVEGVIYFSPVKLYNELCLLLGHDRSNVNTRKEMVVMVEDHGHDIGSFVEDILPQIYLHVCPYSAHLPLVCRTFYTLFHISVIFQSLPAHKIAAYIALNYSSAGETLGHCPLVEAALHHRGLFAHIPNPSILAEVTMRLAVSSNRSYRNWQFGLQVILDHHFYAAPVQPISGLLLDAIGQCMIRTIELLHRCESLIAMWTLVHPIPSAATVAGLGIVVGSVLELPIIWNMLAAMPGKELLPRGTDDDDDAMVARIEQWYGLSSALSGLLRAMKNGRLLHADIEPLSVGIMEHLRKLRTRISEHGGRSVFCSWKGGQQATAIDKKNDI